MMRVCLWVFRVFHWITENVNAYIFFSLSHYTVAASEHSKSEHIRLTDCFLYYFFCFSGDDALCLRCLWDWMLKSLNNDENNMRGMGRQHTHRCVGGLGWKGVGGWIFTRGYEMMIWRDIQYFFHIIFLLYTFSPVSPFSVQCFLTEHVLRRMSLEKKGRQSGESGDYKRKTNFFFCSCSVLPLNVPEFIFCSVPQTRLPLCFA